MDFYLFIYENDSFILIFSLSRPKQGNQFYVIIIAKLAAESSI